jgi:WD40 repeat protein
MNFLVSSSADKTIKVWNLTDGICTQTLTDHPKKILFLSKINQKIEFNPTTIVHFFVR